MAELEPVLVLEAGGQGLAQGVRWQSRPVAVLELGEQHLQTNNTTVLRQFMGKYW